MVSNALKDAKERMEKTIQTTQSELTRIRTGRASASLLDTVRVDYYGSISPLKQVANISVPEPRLIVVQPWDRSMMGEIEKAIMKADIGITPNSDGAVIRLPVPPLTEERRKEMVKLVHQMGEDAKVAVRNIRRDVLDQLKKAQKSSQISEDEEYNAGIDVQEMTDEFVKKVDDLVKAKETEVMEV